MSAERTSNEQSLLTLEGGLQAGYGEIESGVGEVNTTFPPVMDDDPGGSEGTGVEPADAAADVVLAAASAELTVEEQVESELPAEDGQDPSSAEADTAMAALLADETEPELAAVEDEMIADAGMEVLAAVEETIPVDEPEQELAAVEEEVVADAGMEALAAVEEAAPVDEPEQELAAVEEEVVADAGMEALAAVEEAAPIDEPEAELAAIMAEQEAESVFLEPEAHAEQITEAEVLASAVAVTAAAGVQAPRAADLPTAPHIPSRTATAVPPPPAAPTAAASQGVNAWGCLRDVLLVMLGTLLGAGLALGALFYINGTLDFSRHERITAMTSRLAGVESATSALSRQVDANIAGLEQVSADLDGVSEQLREVDLMVGNLAGRTDAVAGQVNLLVGQAAQVGEDLAALQTDVALVTQLVEEAEAQIDDMATQIQVLDEVADRFERFAAGLRDLALSIAGPDVEVEPSAVTPPEEPATAPDPGAVDEPSSALPPNFLGGSPAMDLFPLTGPFFLPEPGQSHILGLVWDDFNRNGVPEEGETPAPGVEVTLRDAQGAPVASIVADESGRFFFANVDPGAYVVELTPPTGADSITPSTVTITVTADGIVEINFAIAR